MTAFDDDAERNLPRSVDYGRQRFSEYAAEEDWYNLGLRYASELARDCSRSIQPLEKPTGAEAADYLSRLIELVTQEILRRQKDYGPYRWLWYLRRLPDSILAGSRPSTFIYDRTLAESLSWYSNGRDTSDPTAPIAFKSDLAAFRHVCRYVAATKYLSHLHSAYRHVGKGAALDTRPDMVKWTDPSEVASAIEVYDSRNDRLTEFELANLGLAAADFDADATDVASRLYLLSSCRPIDVPAYVPDGKDGFCKAVVQARHVWEAVDVKQLLRPYGQHVLRGPPALQLVEPAIVLLMLFRVLARRIPWLLSSTLQLGYFALRGSSLQSAFDEWLPDLQRHLMEFAPEVRWSANYGEWRERVASLHPLHWPLVGGGIMRQSGETMVIDLLAASLSLIRRLTIDRTAADLANDRSFTFELQVQEIVNGSKWRPTAALGALRGRPLRRDGAHVTNIDAIGAMGNVLLLISCKSIIYDPDYERGSYRVVRNLQSTIDSAVVSWAALIGGFHQDPIGHNFDFTGYAAIVGVVCTPFVVYSSSSHTLAESTQGLRSCCSAGELRAWLNAGG